LILKAFGSFFFFLNSSTASRDFPIEVNGRDLEDLNKLLNYLWEKFELRLDLLILDFVVQDLARLYNPFLRVI